MIVKKPSPHLPHGRASVAVAGLQGSLATPFHSALSDALMPPQPAAPRPTRCGRVSRAGPATMSGCQHPGTQGLRPHHVEVAERYETIDIPAS